MQLHGAAAGAVGETVRVRVRRHEEAGDVLSSGDGSRPPSLPQLLRSEREYRLYWSGQMLASIGSWLLQSVLAYVVAVQFTSPTASGLVAFCSLAPVVVVGLYGGVLADRASRRVVLRGAAAAQAACALAFAVLVAGGGASLVGLCVIAAATGVAMGISVPSSQSFVVDLVPRSALSTAVAAASVQFNAARAIGPWFGGILIAAQRLSTAFVLSAVTWLVHAVNLHRLRTSRAAPGGGGVLDGVRHALRTPTLRRLLMCSAAVQFLGTPIITFLALYAEQVLDTGGLGYAGLLSAFGFGAMCNGLLVPRLAAALGRPATYVLSSGMFGISLVAFAAVRHDVLAALLLVVAGAGFVGSFSSLMTAQQLTVRPELRGRVAAVGFLVSMGALPLGTMLQGLAAERVGLPAVTMTAGGLLAAQALVAGVAVRHLRRSGSDRELATVPTVASPPS